LLLTPFLMLLEKVAMGTRVGDQEGRC
jgi:hypothetical protein